MNPWPIRDAVVCALRDMGLDLSPSPMTRIVRQYGDAELLLSASQSAHQFEFGLLERQGEVTVNVLHCALSFDSGQPVNLWVISDTETEWNGEYAVTNFTDSMLQTVLAAVREALQ